uniref:Uncharacterized protein n=1 Tax=Alexandrium monilatum TaxID=311494 RepID=A0A7S4RRD8_9DINO
MAGMESRLRSMLQRTEDAAGHRAAIGGASASAPPQQRAPIGAIGARVGAARRPSSRLLEAVAAPPERERTRSRPPAEQRGPGGVVGAVGAITGGASGGPGPPRRSRSRSRRAHHHHHNNDDIELNHGRLLRLLKLVQRNQGMTPAKEVYNRWNGFCDAHAPAPHEGGRPIRDPKMLSKELIKGFLSEELPRNFWIFLVKKIQANSAQLGVSPDWSDFCDQHAPRLPQNNEKAIRDPRSLDPAFLIVFICCALERDDRSNGGLASLVDEYKFDFSLPGGDGPSKQELQARQGPPPRQRAPREEPPPSSAPPRPAQRMVIGAPPSLANAGLPREPAYGSRPPRETRREPSRPRAHSGPPPHARGGRRHEENGNREPIPPGQLTHGVLHRLLKLVQRNQGSTPPKEIYNRWNEFCDNHAPPITDGGKPARDPKLLSKDLILGFMLELPKPFWISLVKKIQAEGQHSGHREEWTEYCDRFAPQMGNSTSRIRDPRNLDPEFLISFVGSELEHDDPKEGTLAPIIDAYQFDFNLPPRGRQEWEDGPSRKGGGKGGDKGGDEGPGPEQEVQGNLLSEDQVVNMLARVIKLLQRSSEVAKRKWDVFCDQHAPQVRGVAVRDPRKHNADFLRGFLCNEIPVSNWSEAVQRTVVAVPPLADTLDSFMRESSEANPDPWSSPEALLDFLCRSLENHEEVAEVIGVAASSLQE